MAALSKAAQAALDDYRGGVYSVPVPPGSKAPLRKAWQHLRLGPDELAAAFTGGANRGRLLGLPPPPQSGRGFVVCVDLDTPQAVALAPRWLPSTGEIGGRESSPASHWFYECAGEPPPTTRFTDPEGTRLLELLSTGTQVIVPPSIHPTGEPYTWRRQEPRVRVAAQVLAQACGLLAAATLLCSRWPAPGARQDVALALAGGLLRGGWSEARTARFLLDVCTTAGDDEAEKRATTAPRTARQLAAGSAATGWPTLAALLGQEVVHLARRWLGREPLHAQGGTPAAMVALPAPPPALPQPPRPLAETAYHGLAGEVLRLIAPHTEADPAALLLQFLTAYGNAIGHAAGFQVEATLHTANLFCVLVGTSSKARKGTSWQHILRLFRLAAQADPASDTIGLRGWLAGSIKDGQGPLAREAQCKGSSGEGLIWHVRDPLRQWKGDRYGGREVVTDTGVRDKRLLIQTGEFVSAIRCMARNGNTLSAVLRSAWDSGDLRILTRNQPVSATGAHLSLIGHITDQELRHGLTEVELGNGFANRFLWVHVGRSKLLPEGSFLPDQEFLPVAQRLREALTHGAQPQGLRRDEKARARWCEVYPELSRARPGLAGAVAGRAEAQVVRLSLIYALLDRASLVGRPHLEAALEVWRYAAESVGTIFGPATGHPLADRLLEALAKAPEGLSSTAVQNTLGRHAPRESLTEALELLRQDGLVRCETLSTRGRPAQVWRLVASTAQSSPAPALSRTGA